MNYYYAIDNEKHGPFSLDEINLKRLKRDTLVWKEGIESWVKASDLPELLEFLVIEPPPLPKREVIKRHNETAVKKTYQQESKYDLNYKKESDVTVFGVLLILAFILSKVFGLLEFDTPEAYQVFMLISLIIRVLFTGWIVNIAERQNRNKVFWGVFAFISPILCSIIIGQLKKLRLKIKINPNQSKDVQISDLVKKSDKLFYSKRFKDCKLVLDKILELNPNAYLARKKRVLCSVHLSKYEKIKKDLDFLLQNNKYLPFVYYYLGILEIQNNNRKKAIELWLRSKENGFEKADDKLDMYHNFREKYLLSKSNALKKFNETNIDFPLTYECKYKKGISKIDNNENVNKLVTDFAVNNYALLFNIRSFFKSYFVAIAYYEIFSIVYHDDEKYFELQLTNNDIFQFYFNPKLNRNLIIRLYTQFEKKTNKKIKFSSGESINSINDLLE